MAIASSLIKRASTSLRDALPATRQVLAAYPRQVVPTASIILILWLCLRDGLTSSVVQYPYIKSLLDTLSVLLGVFIATSNISNRRLWDLLVAMGGLMCVLAYVPLSVTRVLGLYRVVPAVPIFTLALALPRVFSWSTWPKLPNFVLAFEQAKQVLTKPISGKSVVARMSMPIYLLGNQKFDVTKSPLFTSTASPLVRWLLAISAALAACFALVFDSSSQVLLGSSHILLLTLGLLLCLHAVRRVSEQLSEVLIPIPIVVLILAALYLAAPFAPRLAVVVFGEPENTASASSGMLLLRWLFGCLVAPFVVSGLLDLMWLKKTATEDRRNIVRSAPQTNSDAQNIQPVKRQRVNVRFVALGILALACLVLEALPDSRKPAYFAQSLWALSVTVCSLTFPDLLSRSRKRIQSFLNQHKDHWDDRLSQQVDLRKILWRLAEMIRSFLTWKIDFASVLQDRPFRFDNRTREAHGKQPPAKPAANQHQGTSLRLSYKISPFSLVALQGLALIIGILGLMMAPFGEAHVSSLFAGLWVLAAVVLLQKVGKATRLRMWIRYAGLGALCLLPAVFAFGANVSMPAYRLYDVRMLMLGYGINRFVSEDGLEFINEQGMVTWLAIGTMLLWGIYRAANTVVNPKTGISPAVVEEKKSGDSHEEALDLFCAAVVTIILMLYLGISFSNPGVSLGMALSVGSLFAISRKPKLPDRALLQMRWKAAALSVCAMIAAGAGAVLFVHLIADGYSPGASAAYVTWRHLPISTRRSVCADVSSTMTWPEGHAMIRRCFGAQLDTRLSAPAVVAARITGADASVNPLRAAAATLLGMRISSVVPSDRLFELYINLQNYGYAGVAKTKKRTIGVSQASELFFGVAPSGLTIEQTDFLLNTVLRVDTFSLQGSANSVRFAAAPARYLYTRCSMKGFPAPSGWEMHNGIFNNRGEYAAYMVADPSVPYVSSTKGAKALDTYAAGTEAYAVNDAGQVAGSSSNWAALWDKSGAIHNIGTLPGLTYCAARAINNRGDITGYAWNTDAQEGQSQFQNTAHAFLWSHNQMHDLGVPYGYLASRAYAINDDDQMAGWLLTKSGQTHAMVWQNGVFHDLGTFPGGQASVAGAINNAGQVVGSSQHQNGTVTACLWQNGRILDLGRLPGDVYSRALGINNLGQIVGESRLDTNVNYPGGTAFLWDAQHGMRDLTPLFATDSVWRKRVAHCTTALSINDRQEILGYGFYETVKVPRYHFLLSPMRSHVAKINRSTRVVKQ